MHRELRKTLGLLHPFTGLTGPSRTTGETPFLINFIMMIKELSTYRQIFPYICQDFRSFRQFRGNFEYFASLVIGMHTD